MELKLEIIGVDFKDLPLLKRLKKNFKLKKIN
jgi:hypothetical protein